MNAFRLPLLAAAFFAWAAAFSPTVAAGEPVRYILDTDIASDCDDAGAVAMVNALADNGEVNVLAMMVCTGGPYGAPALSAINGWYGRQDIPLGTLKDPAFWVGGGPDKPAGAFNYESYNQYLATRFPVTLKSGTDAPDATALYRRILAAQPDASVVVNTIGPLVNLRKLMESPADATSPLNGMDLIRAKVKLLVVTGGRNPEGTSSNFSKQGAGVYAKPVIEGWPTPVVFVGNEIGGKILTGWDPAPDAASRGNPARAAYGRFHGTDTQKHHTSDQAGILYAIRGNGAIFALVEDGHQVCDEKGQTQWVPGPAPAGRHAYVRKLDGADAAIAAAAEALMNQGRKPPAR